MRAHGYGWPSVFGVHSHPRAHAPKPLRVFSHSHTSRDPTQRAEETSLKEPQGSGGVTPVSRAHKLTQETEQIASLRDLVFSPFCCLSPSPFRRLTFTPCCRFTFALAAASRSHSRASAAAAASRSSSRSCSRARSNSASFARRAAALSAGIGFLHPGIVWSRA